MSYATIYIVPTFTGEGARHLCGDCMGPDDQAEGHTAGNGDDACEVCEVPDWEEEEEGE